MSAPHKHQNTPYKDDIILPVDITKAKSMLSNKICDGRVIMKDKEKKKEPMEHAKDKGEN